MRKRGVIKVNFILLVFVFFIVIIVTIFRGPNTPLICHKKWNILSRGELAPQSNKRKYEWRVSMYVYANMSLQYIHMSQFNLKLIEYSIIKW